MKSSQGHSMTHTSLHPLRAAIKQALHEPGVVHSKVSASTLALLALSAAALSPQARSADDYTANDETSLRTAITNANGDGDPSATITLTGNITMAGTIGERAADSCISPRGIFLRHAQNEIGRASPRITRMSVLFPEPEGPSPVLAALG